MFHQGLLQPAGLAQHILSGVDDSVLQAQQQVEIAEAEIGIEDSHPVPQPGQGDPKVGREGGLADPPLAGADDDGAGGDGRHGGVRRRRRLRPVVRRSGDCSRTAIRWPQRLDSLCRLA